MAQEQGDETGLGGPVSNQMTTRESSTSEPVVASIPPIDPGSFTYDPPHRRAALDPPSTIVYDALTERIDDLRLTGVRSLQLTSPNPEEGTSTVAVHLAVALASDGTDVVLIDANLRRPHLRELLDLDGRTGLADIILGRARLSDVMHEIEDTEGLVVVPAGVVSQNPAYLMVDSATEDRVVTLSQIVASLADLGYFVIVDSPPVLMVTDALAMARSVDALLVISNSASRSADLTRARTLLAQVAAPVCGRVVVHSKAPRPTSDAGPSASPGVRLRAAFGRARPKRSQPEGPAPELANRVEAERPPPSRVRLATAPAEPAPPATVTRPERIESRQSADSVGPPASPRTPSPPAVGVVVPPMPPSPRLGQAAGDLPVAVPTTEEPQPIFLSRTVDEVPVAAKPAERSKHAYPPVPTGRLTEHRGIAPSVSAVSTESAVCPTASPRPPIPPPPRPPIPPPPPPPPAPSPPPEIRHGRARRHRVRAKLPEARTARP